jgi:antitoxin CptB
MAPLAVRRTAVCFFSSSSVGQRLSSSELEEKRRRMLYHSKQRGWLELDLILGTFAECHLAKLAEKDVVDFEKILEEENPDLFKWLSGQSPVPSEFKEMDVLKLLMKHVNENHPETFQNQ